MNKRAVVNVLGFAFLLIFSASAALASEKKQDSFDSSNQLSSLEKMVMELTKKTTELDGTIDLSMKLLIEGLEQDLEKLEEKEKNKKRERKQ